MKSASLTAASVVYPISISSVTKTLNILNWFIENGKKVTIEAGEEI